MIRRHRSCTRRCRSFNAEWRTDQVSGLVGVLGQRPDPKPWQEIAYSVALTIFNIDGSVRDTIQGSGVVAYYLVGPPPHGGLIQDLESRHPHASDAPFDPVTVIPLPGFGVEGLWLAICHWAAEADLLDFAPTVSAAVAPSPECSYCAMSRGFGHANPNEIVDWGPGGGTLRGVYSGGLTYEYIVNYSPIAFAETFLAGYSGPSLCCHPDTQQGSAGSAASAHSAEIAEFMARDPLRREGCCG